MREEIGRSIVVAGAIIGAAFLVMDFFSPYNQCVRAQTTINESGKVSIHPFPKEDAKVRCAEAFGQESP